MKLVKLLGFILLTVLISSSYFVQEIPSSFIDAKSIIKDLDVELRYYTSNNFVGDTIRGYHANRLFLTKPTVEALAKVQDSLQTMGLCLLVYDGYRPQQAVNHFIEWAKDLDDTIQKQQFYPNTPKSTLFQEGYIASQSGHSRGSTVDLTIIDAASMKPLDMGSPYDFFGTESWVEYPNINEKQKANREVLQGVMNAFGFRSYSKEWWHFTLRNEPFPETYFNFPIK